VTWKYVVVVEWWQQRKGACAYKNNILVQASKILPTTVSQICEI
jgi:hypothetical protein